MFETRSGAERWEDGSVVGGGRVGAIIHGVPGAQVVSLAHERFFIPVNPATRAPHLEPWIGPIRDAVLAGDDGHATQLLGRAIVETGFDEGLVWTNPLGISATLEVRTPTPKAGTLRRRIDLEHGESITEWDEEGGSILLRALVPRDEAVVWLAIEAAPGTCVHIRLGLEPGEGHSGFMGAGNARRALDVELTGGARARLETSAATRDGRLSAVTIVDGGWTWVRAGQYLTARIDIPASGRALIRAETLVADGGECPAAVGPHPSPEWEGLRRAQAATHGELLRRSVLHLRGDEALEPTEQTWRRARAGDIAARRRVVEIAWLSGRSNALSATGDFPPTLQGVWQGTWTPAWSADYTLNGNLLNGGMASLIPTGTPELARSLLRMVLPHLDDYRDNADRIFGAQGMLLPSRMSDNGRANHFSADFPHVFWTGAGGWVLRVAADLVSTTGDRSVVDDDLWALATGVLEFAESATVVLGGRRHIVPGYSPENTPGGGTSPIASDPTMDIAILRDAARCTRLLGEARGDDSLDERWRHLVADMPEYRIAPDGGLAEWIDQRWSDNHAHRHASHLYPLWYEPDEAFVGPSASAQALRRAAAATINRKVAWRSTDPTAPPGNMEMSSGLVQLGLAAACLGETRAALRCVEWLALDHWNPALTTTHDAGRLFNFDASGGLPAVVASMLVASDRRSVTVFPALPDEWVAGGCITGLTARGGIVVDRLRWDRWTAELTLRRRTEAAWMHAHRVLIVHAGGGFRFVGNDAARSVLDVGEEPVVVRLSRTLNGG